MANEKQNKDEANVKDTDKEGGGEEKAPKSKKKLLIIVLAAVLVLGGAAAFFLLSSSEEESAPAENAEANVSEENSESLESSATTEENQASKPATTENKTSLLDKITGKNKSNFGDTINLKPFNINLGNPLENRYIRLEIALEYKGKEAQRKEIERRMPQLRDAIISVTSKRSRESLLSVDGKDQLRKELLIIINRYMDNPIESVYITDMLID